MLRTTTTGPILRNLAKQSSFKPLRHTASKNAISTSRLHTLSSTRPRIGVTASLRPITTSLVRFATKPEPPFDKINPEAERKVLEKEIEVHPEDVSGGSSVRHVFEQSQSPETTKENMGGVAGDFQTIKETFALTAVPKESLYIGAAGVLPYLATSLSTVYLAWDINHAKATGSGVLFSPDLARDLLAYVEPIQVALDVTWETGS